ncbi:MAG: aldolase/citrate lyase family protein [bacterium]|nr:aldolase/citrate lyase family protein [bacterium]
MKAPSFSSLQSQLKELKRDSGLTALKTGTEVEDMSFEEIRLLRALSDRLLPLYVKIGGPEARNDIRELSRIGVDGLIAPMIESPYALKNFIGSLRDCLGPTSYDRIEKGINLETITGFQNMNEILSSPAAAELDQVTAARSDLSGSMELTADDPRVLEICSLIIARCRENDLRTSVGGGIHPEIAETLIDTVAPEHINTRHMVLSCADMATRAAECVERVLLFELELSRYLADMPSDRQAAHQARAETIRLRLERSRSILHLK